MQRGVSDLLSPLELVAAMSRASSTHGDDDDASRSGVGCKHGEPYVAMTGWERGVSDAREYEYWVAVGGDSRTEDTQYPQLSDGLGEGSTQLDLPVCGAATAEQEASLSIWRMPPVECYDYGFNRHPSQVSISSAARGNDRGSPDDVLPSALLQITMWDHYDSEHQTAETESRVSDNAGGPRTPAPGTTLEKMVPLDAESFILSPLSVASLQEAARHFPNRGVPSTRRPLIDEAQTDADGAGSRVEDECTWEVFPRSPSFSCSVLHDRESPVWSSGAVISDSGLEGFSSDYDYNFGLQAMMRAETLGFGSQPSFSMITDAFGERNAAVRATQITSLLDSEDTTQLFDSNWPRTKSSDATPPENRIPVLKSKSGTDLFRQRRKDSTTKDESTSQKPGQRGRRPRYPDVHTSCILTSEVATATIRVATEIAAASIGARVSARQFLQQDKKERGMHQLLGQRWWPAGEHLLYPGGALRHPSTPVQRSRPSAPSSVVPQCQREDHGGHAPKTPGTLAPTFEQIYQDILGLDGLIAARARGPTDDKEHSSLMRYVFGSNYCGSEFDENSPPLLGCSDDTVEMGSCAPSSSVAVEAGMCECPRAQGAILLPDGALSLLPIARPNTSDPVITPGGTRSECCCGVSEGVGDKLSKSAVAGASEGATPTSARVPTAGNAEKLPLAYSFHGCEGDASTSEKSLHHTADATASLIPRGESQSAEGHHYGGQARFQECVRATAETTYRSMPMTTTESRATPDAATSSWRVHHRIARPTVAVTGSTKEELPPNTIVSDADSSASFGDDGYPMIGLGTILRKRRREGKASILLPTVYSSVESQRVSPSPSTTKLPKSDSPAGSGTPSQGCQMPKQLLPGGRVELLPCAHERKANNEATGDVSAGAGVKKAKTAPLKGMTLIEATHRSDPPSPLALGKTPSARQRLLSAERKGAAMTSRRAARAKQQERNDQEREMRAEAFLIERRRASATKMKSTVTTHLPAQRCKETATRGSGTVADTVVNGNTGDTSQLASATSARHTNNINLGDSEVQTLATNDTHVEVSVVVMTDIRDRGDGMQALRMLPKSSCRTTGSQIVPGNSTNSLFAQVICAPQGGCERFEVDEYLEHALGLKSSRFHSPLLGKIQDRLIAGQDAALLLGGTKSTVLLSWIAVNEVVEGVFEKMQPNARVSTAVSYVRGGLMENLLTSTGRLETLEVMSLPFYGPTMKSTSYVPVDSARTFSKLLADSLETTMEMQGHNGGFFIVSLILTQQKADDGDVLISSLFVANGGSSASRYNGVLSKNPYEPLALFGGALGGGCNIVSLFTYWAEDEEVLPLMKTQCRLRSISSRGAEVGSVTRFLSRKSLEHHVPWEGSGPPHCGRGHSHVMHPSTTPKERMMRQEKALCVLKGRLAAALRNFPAHSVAEDIQVLLPIAFPAQALTRRVLKKMATPGSLGIATLDDSGGDVGQVVPLDRSAGKRGSEHAERRVTKKNSLVRKATSKSSSKIEVNESPLETEGKLREDSAAAAAAVHSTSHISCACQYGEQTSTDIELKAIEELPASKLHRSNEATVHKVGGSAEAPRAKKDTLRNTGPERQGNGGSVQTARSVQRPTLPPLLENQSRCVTPTEPVQGPMGGLTILPPIPPDSERSAHLLSLRTLHSRRSTAIHDDAGSSTTGVCNLPAVATCLSETALPRQQCSVEPQDPGDDGRAVLGCARSGSRWGAVEGIGRHAERSIASAPPGRISPRILNPPDWGLMSVPDQRCNAVDLPVQAERSEDLPDDIPGDRGALQLQPLSASTRYINSSAPAQPQVHATMEHPDSVWARPIFKNLDSGSAGEGSSDITPAVYPHVEDDSRLACETQREVANEDIDASPSKGDSQRGAGKEMTLAGGANSDPGTEADTRDAGPCGSENSACESSSAGEDVCTGGGSEGGTLLTSDGDEHHRKAESSRPRAGKQAVRAVVVVDPRCRETGRIDWSATVVKTISRRGKVTHRYVVDEIVERSDGCETFRSSTLHELQHQFLSGKNAAILAADSRSSAMSTLAVKSVVHCVLDRIQRRTHASMGRQLDRVTGNSAVTRDSAARRGLEQSGYLSVSIVYVSGELATDLLREDSVPSRLVIRLSPQYGPYVGGASQRQVENPVAFDTMLMSALTRGDVEGANEVCGIVVVLLVLKRRMKRDGDVVVSSLMTTLAGENAGQYAAVLDNNPFIPKALFHYALGGPCFTVALLGISGDETNVRQMLGIQQRLRKEVNEPGQVGSTLNLIHEIEERVMPQLRRALAKPLSPVSREAVEKKVEQLSEVLSEAVELIKNIRNPLPKNQVEDTTLTVSAPPSRTNRQLPVVVVKKRSAPESRETSRVNTLVCVEQKTGGNGCVAVRGNTVLVHCGDRVVGFSVDEAVQFRRESVFAVPKLSDELVNQFTSGKNAALLVSEALATPLMPQLAEQLLREVCAKVNIHSNHSAGEDGGGVGISSGTPADSRLPPSTAAELLVSIALVREGISVDLIIRSEENALHRFDVNYSPLFGHCFRGVPFHKVTSADHFRVMLREAVRRALPTSALSDPGIFVVHAMLKQPKNTFRRDVLVSSLMITTVFSKIERYVSIAARDANEPFKLFQTALGGQCYTVSMLGLSDDDDGAMDMLLLQRKLAQTVNMTPSECSVADLVDKIKNQILFLREEKSRTADPVAKSVIQTTIDELMVTLGDSEEILRFPTTQQARGYQEAQSVD